MNRKLSAVSAFYQHAARHGVRPRRPPDQLAAAGRRGTAWRPFLHHISKSQPGARLVIGLKVPTNCSGSARGAPLDASGVVLGEHQRGARQRVVPVVLADRVQERVELADLVAVALPPASSVCRSAR